MSKRTVRRPTEDQALANVMREQKFRVKDAVSEVLRRVRAGEQVDLKLRALAVQVFTED